MSLLTTLITHNLHCIFDRQICNQWFGVERNLAICKKLFLHFSQTLNFENNLKFHCSLKPGASFWIVVDKSNKCFQMLLTAVLTSLLEFRRILLFVKVSIFLLFQSIISALRTNKNKINMDKAIPSVT